MSGPVWQGDFPDPFVLNVAGSYVAVGTNAAGRNVQVLTSGNLTTWRQGPDALPSLPSWSQPGNTWAPALLARPAGFVLYYTVREPRSGRQAISVASATEPVGPFIDQSAAPLIFQIDLGGSIDPSPFVDYDGRLYLFWKSDENAIGQRTRLWGQELRADGLALVGSPAQLLTGDMAWEQPLVEAPSVIRQLDRYYLFYSANWWNTGRYGIGYAVGSGPLGPFAKQTTNGPWFASRHAMAGPGGQEFFIDSNGDLRMVYHAWDTDRIGYPRGARRLHIAAVRFEGDHPVAFDGS